MSKSLIYSHLYAWYEVNRRNLPWRETEDPYAIWLSEIILQQTRVAQGLDYYRRFLARWRTVEDLAAADEAEVLREWQGLGYYSRARNLHKAAKMIVEKASPARGDGSIFPRTFDEIRALPGIGDYTAGAIASFAYNLPYPAMDGNVYRVVARLLDIDEPFDTSAGKKLFHNEIEKLLDRENPRLFNSAIMEFGALYCTPVLGDACATCPLSDFCLAHAHGTAELLPVRKPRPKVRDRWLDYHIYINEQMVNDQMVNVFTLIHRRENPKDIWYHLYEFPCEEHPNAPINDPYGEADRMNEVNKEMVNDKMVNVLHTLSHQRLHARFIIHKVSVLPQIEGTIAIPLSALDEYAFSRLTLRALDTLLPSLLR